MFQAVTLVDPARPIPAEWLEAAGIDYVYTSGALSLAADSEGRPVLSDAQQARWEALQAIYGTTNVRVLIMSNYYAHPPEGTEAVDVSGRPLAMACLRSDRFHSWMHDRITAQTKAYSAFSVFGGFVFDDGWGTRVDACYCDHCREIFGDTPPTFAVREGTGIVPDDATELRWDAFQRQSHERYIRTQSSAVREVSDDAMMLTIPSDSFFYGRLLNANLPREELALSASALLQRIERMQVRDWHLYQSFPLPRLPEGDEEGLQPWGIGAHFTADSPKLVLCNEGPFIQHTSRMQMMSPAEIEQMIRITVVEGAQRMCYWASGAYTGYHPDGFAAMARVYEEIRPIESLLASRTPFPARVGLLYSTTTEVLEQPWRENLSERWQHLHSVEATAWALRRGGVWHRIIMESDLPAAAAADLDVLILPSIRFVSQAAADALETAMASGTAVVALGETVDIPGATRPAHDVTFWHRCIRDGYRQSSNLDLHYENAEEHLLPLIRSLSPGPVAVSAQHSVSALHCVGKDLLLMAANWLRTETDDVVLTAQRPFRITDAESGEDLGIVSANAKRTVSVPPAGWRVLRVEVMPPCP
ncbi:MAG: hypothetical protein HN742_23565 [Lentisphaerae bacterium]|jgi:hypothetical protein|nr:hypothetical protein [Lentisphaerota bacterium]MBT4814509.1 hypothetical protein [Lentisphaerota bacterium]MBT5605206.1 hypothetical protein [Lentisphaerota bacterium]MBT7054342.1 hypothetical protein [Lentisphaerota bacterium]MBT7844874.1 hypothetical protein [Lentisphaerota bacterium]